MQSWKYLSSQALAPALQMPIDEQLFSYSLAAPLPRLRLLHMQSPTPFPLLDICLDQLDQLVQVGHIALV